MVARLEVLAEPGIGSATAIAWLPACLEGARAAGLAAGRRGLYTGEADWLTFFGFGTILHNESRLKHVASGRHVFGWDMGYFGRAKDKSQTYLRVSVDHWHPTHEQMERTEPDPSRWRKFALELRDDANPNGHVVVVGLGVKSRVFWELGDLWEHRALKSAGARFPGRRIVYRPKPNTKHETVVWPDTMATQPIEEVLRGASLVICKHSNVAIDACIAGVPVECEDGAAHWLYSASPAPTRHQRLDFLYRLCWWQWRMNEMGEAWKYLLKAFG